MTIYGPDKAPLAKAIAFAKAHLDLQQLGQSADDAVWDGSTGCTHTVWQFLIYLWTGHRLTLNEINSLAGMPYKARNADGDPRGMNSNEVSHLIAAVNAKYGTSAVPDPLPYVVVWDYSYDELLAYSNRAPVFKAVAYGRAPSWQGYTYNGLTAKSPFAQYAGRTQLGYNFRHADLILGYRTVVDSAGTVLGWHEWKKDPNHGSAARPEKPPFELITTGQGKTEYDAYASTWGIRLYGAVATRPLPVDAAPSGGDMFHAKSTSRVLGTVKLNGAGHYLLSSTDPVHTRYGPRAAGESLVVVASYNLVDAAGHPIDIDGDQPPVNHRDQVYLVDKADFGACPLVLRADCTALA